MNIHLPFPGVSRSTAPEAGGPHGGAPLDAAWNDELAFTDGPSWLPTVGFDESETDDLSESSGAD